MMMQPPPKIIDVKIEKVELHQTENAWKPAKLSETTTIESQVSCTKFIFVIGVERTHIYLVIENIVTLLLLLSVKVVVL